MKNSKQENPDYIIIGAGSAGCVMANRLSKNNSVLLLEAGPKDHSWDFRLQMPAALSHVLSNDTYNWFYNSETEPHLDDRNMYCPRGRVMGGSSSINGMIFVRGNSEDFNNWSKNKGLESWSYENCLPFFKKSENSISASSDRRGDQGPMEVSHASAKNPLFKAWVKAGAESGLGNSDDFNGHQQEGLGLFDRTIRNGQRLSAAKAYVDPVRKRNSLEIRTKVLVRKILIEDKTAVGVEVSQNGIIQELRANREIILCGGAINSPQLLMLSGIGARDHLQQHDIEVIQDLPGVGQNLQDHLELYVQYECTQPVSVYPALKWYRQPFIGIEWYLNKTGMAATNHFEAGGFLKSSEQVTYPDLQFHFLPVAMNYDGRHKFDGHGFQVHVGPMKPTSRGSVSLKSKDPGTAPKIQFNYNQTEEDKSVMRAGIRLARKIVSQAAFDPYRGREIQPGIDATSDEDLDSFIRQHGESAYHPSCTCKMGYDELAVVDAEAKVHNISNLRIVDASIMPEVTNGNLNAPVLMMAEKVASLILNEEP